MTKTVIMFNLNINKVELYIIKGIIYIIEIKLNALMTLINNS